MKRKLNTQHYKSCSLRLKLVPIGVVYPYPRGTIKLCFFFSVAGYYMYAVVFDIYICSSVHSKKYP